MDLKDPVLTNMHCVRRWLSAAINLVLIIPQASGKQYKPRSCENHDKKQTRARHTGKYWVFTMSFLQLSGRASEELIKRSKDPLLLGALGVPFLRGCLRYSLTYITVHLYSSCSPQF